jgi:Flp pilus assembly protein TadD
MKRYLSLLVFVVLLTGCVSTEILPIEDHSHILSGEILGLQTHPLPTSDVLQVNNDMKDWVKKHTRASTNARARLRHLIQGLIDDGLLTLEYDENLTHTAIETFERRKGNCLSFSMLFVALARQADLNVTFQMVDIPPSFSSTGELVMLNNHINVLVRRIRSDSQFHQNHVVDFNTAEYDGNYDTRRVTDSYATALYHSNVGVEFMRNSDHTNAFLHFKKGIQLDHKVPGIWTNLGALYSQAGHHDHAIDAYLQALTLSPTYKSALVNLAGSLEALDRHDEADHYRNRSRFYQRLNPYFHYQNARKHYAEGKLDLALRDLGTAINIKDDEHQFYSLKGMIHLAMGEQDLASESYLEAMEKAQRAEASERYGNKLRVLRNES